MDQDRENSKLDPLWAQYREACPDPEPTAHFMPQMWQRIEARRNAMSSAWFRLWAGIWLGASVVAIVMGAVVIPRLQNPPAYHVSYVDVLAAADSANDAVVLLASETE